MQPQKPQQRIFVFGGDVESKFAEYVCDLVGKPEPRICYLPTASADHPDNIRHWEFICKNLGIEPHVLRVWIDSGSETSFEELLLGMDAIVVGGGNTLNMLGIWKSQGIDEILHEALKRGIVLSGGSAGSLLLVPVRGQRFPSRQSLCGRGARVSAFQPLSPLQRCAGSWKCAGEDLGGFSEADAEMRFRERVPAMALGR